MTATKHGRPTGPILVALLSAALAYALAQTMVAPAIPAITDEYDTTTASSAWVLTGFLLSASVCTPLAGKLGDLFGKARVMAIVLVLFGVGSIICALAATIEVVIAGRVLMGAAGGIFPLAFGIANDEFPAKERAVAIGLISATFGIGGGIGLPLSGVVVDNLDLSFLFWMGVIAFPAAIAVVRLVPPSPARARTSVDLPGAIILSLGLVALLLGISKANAWGWGSARTLTLMIGGVVVLVLFVVFELHRREPLVDIRILRRRSVLFTNLVSLLTGVGMFGSFLLVPGFVQAAESTGYGFGLSVTQAGLLMAPSAAVMLFVGPFAGQLGNRFGFRSVLATGTALLTVSFTLMCIVHDELWQFIMGNLLTGAGIALAFSSMANLIVGAVPREDVGIATGINTIMRTIGGAFGAAMVSALLTADTIGGTTIPTEDAYTEAFLAAAITSLLGLAATLAIPRIRGGGQAEPVRGAPREASLAPEPT